MTKFLKVGKNTDFNETTEIKRAYVNRDIKAYYFPSKSGVNLSHLCLTNISLYSTTPWEEANLMSQMIVDFFKSKGHEQPLVITDATANIGGNAISFYLNGFSRVNAVEIEPMTCQLLKENLKAYGYLNEHVYCDSYLNVYEKLDQDVIFIDPPWGGPDYKSVDILDIYLGPTNLIDLCHKLIQNKQTSLIVLKLPTNYNLITLMNTCPNNRFLIHKVFRNKRNAYNLVFCSNC